MIDPKAGKRLTNIPLGGKPEYGVSAGDGKVYAPDSYRVLENVETQTGARNMGLDPTNRRIFLVSAKFGPVPSGAPA